MKILYINARLYPNEIDFYDNGCLLVEDGKILDIFQFNENHPLFDNKNIEIIDCENNIMIPGMIDIHCHGSYGYDFIDNPPISCNEVSKRLIEDGCTGYCASLTVVSHESLCDLLKQYAQVKNDPYTSQFLGVHSEGPYLSKEYKALMDETYLRNPSITEFEEMRTVTEGTLKIMTVAPELEGMEHFINQVSDQCSIMIGHTAATSEDVSMAVENGALGFTHLYNAMSQHSHREPGTITGAMLHDQTLAEIIVDGFHVHPDVVRATYKLFTAKRLILVTDSMPGKDMPDGNYLFSNLKCTKKGKFVRVTETGRIAGSCISMIDAIQNMKTYCDCTMNEIVQMACTNPAKIAQAKTKGSLTIGMDADMITLNDNLELQSTIISGKIVYKKPI